MTARAIALLLLPLPCAAQITGGPPPTPASGPDTGVVLSPACAKALDDLAGAGCLKASSVPALGLLFPLSSDLFIDAATGEVGIGTTNPLARFNVNGTSRFEDDMTVIGKGTFVDLAVASGLDFLALSGMQFPAASSPNLPPMLGMFAAGIANADRMVIGHSPGFPSYGLEYEDVGDRFVFQRSTSERVLTVDLQNGDLLLGEDTGTLRFPAASGPTSPMIDMFATGTSNADRMVLAHSPLVPEWGLEYSDASDVFQFQRSALDPVLTLDMNAAPTRVLAIDSGDLQGNGNVLELRADRCGNSASVQLIEAVTSRFLIGCILDDIEFRVDEDGSVYADGGFNGAADFAEMIRASGGAEALEPGDVLVIDPHSSRSVARSSTAYSTLVAGVYSTRPGFVGSEREWDELPTDGPAAEATERVPITRAEMTARYDEIPLAVVGIVPAKVSAENGAIRPGDLLVTAGTPGHAMRAEDPPNGTIVGKALEPLAGGTGRIRVLVTLQ